MAKRKNGVNKSQAVRDLLTKNPEMRCKEVIAALAAEGIKINSPLYYFVKGKMKGRKGRRRKIRQVQGAVAAVSVNADPLATILKVQKLAAEVGGLKKLKALVEALGA